MISVARLVEEKLAEKGWSMTDLTELYIRHGYTPRALVAHRVTTGRCFEERPLRILFDALDISEEEFRGALEERLAEIEAIEPRAWALWDFRDVHAIRTHLGLGSSPAMFPTRGLSLAGTVGFLAHLDRNKERLRKS